MLTMGWVGRKRRIWCAVEGDRTTYGIAYQGKGTRQEHNIVGRVWRVGMVRKGSGGQ